VFENRVLRKIYGPKRDEVTGEWRKLHNEQLHILYSSPNIIRQIKSRRMRWVGEDRDVYKVLMGKPEGKRPLGIFIIQSCRESYKSYSYHLVCSADKVTGLYNYH
jgi:hypothetical protein